MPMMLIPALNFIKGFGKFVLVWWREIVIFTLVLAVLHYNTKLKETTKHYNGEIAKRDVAYLKLKNDIVVAEKQYIEHINQLNKQASKEVDKLQEKHDNEIEAINNRNVKLTSSVNSLQQTLERNRSSVSDTFAGIKDPAHPSNAESLFNATSESFGECITEYSTLATTSDKLQSSVTTLQESWEAVRKQYNGGKENVSTQP